MRSLLLFLLRKGISTCFFVPLFFIIALAPTGAASPILTFDSGRIIGTTGDVTYGFEFKVLQPFTAGALGVFDLGQDGLAEGHSVGLFSSTGALLRSVTLPAGASGMLVNQFRYAPIAPISLVAGQNYRLGVYYATSIETILDFPENFVVDPNLEIVGGRWRRFGFRDPINDNTSLHNPAMFGPNMLIIPEPSIAALTMVGGLTLAGCPRRRQNT